eukprot:gene5360-biopygen13266
MPAPRPRHARATPAPLHCDPRGWGSGALGETAADATRTRPGHVPDASSAVPPRGEHLRKTGVTLEMGCIRSTERTKRGRSSHPFPCTNRIIHWPNIAWARCGSPQQDELAPRELELRAAQGLGTLREYRANCSCLLMVGQLPRTVHSDHTLKEEWDTTFRGEGDLPRRLQTKHQSQRDGDILKLGGGGGSGLVALVGLVLASRGRSREKPRLDGDVLKLVPRADRQQDLPDGHPRRGAVRLPNRAAHTARGANKCRRGDCRNVVGGCGTTRGLWVCGWRRVVVWWDMHPQNAPALLPPPTERTNDTDASRKLERGERSRPNGLRFWLAHLTARAQGSGQGPGFSACVRITKGPRCAFPLFLASD